MVFRADETRRSFGVDPGTSLGERILSALLRIPLLWRRGLPVLLAVAIIATVLVSRYQEGGGRLSVGGLGGVSAPANVGEEFHTFLQLDTAGVVTLLSAQAVDVDPGLRADLRLVQAPKGPSVTARRGPIEGIYQEVPLAGQVLDSNSSDSYWLDLRLVATVPGIYTVKAVEITYDAGFLRTRTAQGKAWICLSASSDWRSDDRHCPVPE